MDRSLQAEVGEASRDVQFLAKISHEIRTPLGAVLGFADLLSQEPASEEERRNFLAAIVRNGESVMRLVDDLLDYSRIEAKQFKLDHQTFSLRSLLQEIREDMELRAKEGGIILKVDELVDDVSLSSDSLRIKQILANLLGNAIKFTSQGSVRLRTQIVDNVAVGRFIKVIFLIEDTGIGLSHMEMHRLFHPFSQADTSTALRFGGTGLGLVISRELARLMGGDVRLLASQPQVGSVFEVSLVLERQTHS
ncbi:MAG: ATP-binding protein [Bdellovibrio sp.]